MFPSRPNRFVGRFNAHDRPYPNQMPAVYVSAGPSTPTPLPPLAPPAAMTVVVPAPPAIVAPPAAAPIVIPAPPVGPVAPAAAPVIVVPYTPAAPTAAPTITIPSDPPVKPTIGGDPDVPDPSNVGCPAGPYLGTNREATHLDVSASPLSALHTTAKRTAATADVTVPAGYPILCTARDILDHRSNRHTCDFRIPLADALRRLRVACPTHPWWAWLASHPAILETMVLVNSGGIWNAVAPCEDFRAYKGTTKARLGCSFGLFQINEFYAAPVFAQAQATLGSCMSELTVSPSDSRTLSQLSKYNDDPGPFAWSRALCHRPQGVMWGCLFAGYYIRQLAVYVDPLTGNGRGAYQTLGLTAAVAAAKAMKPAAPGAVWLRAMWIGGTLSAAAKIITSKDARLTTYLGAMT